MAGQRPVFDPDRISVPRPNIGGRTFTVSQLNSLIKRVLSDQLPGSIHLIGEISNLTRHTSGHVYLTLKDDRAEIRCVMWRSTAAAVKFDLKDGLEVVATGHVDVYEPRGQYQFQIKKIEPKGTGALELAFRQLRERLEREGLFDPARKKPIPRFPRHIVLVTSPTGAALHDMLRTLTRRFPCVRISLYPVRVQGEGAAGDIAKAIGLINRRAAEIGGVDLMIVGRGGGSLEDLWAFNEEVVARAIFASKIPIISAVGHEVDVTIADLTADLRAATPTAAAELAVPVLEEVRATLLGNEADLRRNLRHLLDQRRAQLDRLAQSPWLRDPLTFVRHQEQRLDETASRLRLAIADRVGRARHSLHEAELALAAIHPRTLAHTRERRLNTLADRLRQAVAHRLTEARRDLHAREVRLVATSPRTLLRHHRQGLEEIDRRLAKALRNRMALTRTALDALASRLEASSYRKTLRRGYTITRNHKTGRIITAADQVAIDDAVLTETGNGRFTSRVSENPANPPAP